jgi:predicted nucleic acid-binding Zn ribbon protein
MGHDPDAKEIAERGCPECGGNLSLEEKERVPGGADWYNYKCDECGHEMRV